MLELNTYSVQEVENLKDFFLVCYVIIDDIYHQVIPGHIRFRRNYSVSKLSDSEVITLAIVGEVHGIHSKKAWFNYVLKNITWMNGLIIFRYKLDFKCFSIINRFLALTFSMRLFLSNTTGIKAKCIWGLFPSQNVSLNALLLLWYIFYS